MAEWYGVADSDQQTRVLNAWPDAPLVNLEVCEMILETAREQVIAYAPKDEPAEVEVTRLLLRLGYDDAAIAAALATLGLNPPAAIVRMRYVYAQLQQAKNLFNAGRAQEDGGVGAEGFSFIPRPLDKTVRAIIRPIDGRPHVL